MHLHLPLIIQIYSTHTPRQKRKITVHSATAITNGAIIPIMGRTNKTVVVVATEDEREGKKQTNFFNFKLNANDPTLSSALRH